MLDAGCSIGVRGTSAGCRAIVVRYCVIALLRLCGVRFRCALCVVRRALPDEPRNPHSFAILAKLNMGAPAISFKN
jgi:hypothetical protein